MGNQEIYQNARKKVEAKLRFRTHLSVYVAVTLLLFTINMINTPEYWWFKWPAMGWGIGVAIHAFQVFFIPKQLSATEKMVMKQVEKDTAKNL